MIMPKPTVKYEVVVGVPDDTEYPIFCPGPEFSVITGTMMKCQLDEMRSAWKKYAKEFYEANDIYVSAIAIPGRALYHEDWGCPENGERVLSFHCTANPEFIKDLHMYEEGIQYIAKKLKKEFKQHTITITRLYADIVYLTDDNNEEE